MLEAVSRQMTCDMVAAELTAFIISQGLKPGDPLPTGHELAASFGVNRLSLREATITLGFLAIVEAKLGRGLSVGETKLEREGSEFTHVRSMRVGTNVHTGSHVRRKADRRDCPVSAQLRSGFRCGCPW
jgi:DNA-binding FadR family transcriptional regulator